MFSEVFLAMTSREMAEYQPKKAAYLSCHFSPYGSGLSNIPDSLPPKSLLLVDDSTPPDGHNPQGVTEQLKGLIEKFQITGILLDFQNSRNEACMAMAKALSDTLPCPVAVTEGYAEALGSPVFLSSPPENITLEKYIAPWKKQGVFLEIAPDGLQITVTEKGAYFSAISSTEQLPLYHRKFHCHYRVEVLQDRAIFTLGRHKEDLLTLAQDAKKLGVLGVIGLYQELMGI